MQSNQTVEPLLNWLRGFAQRHVNSLLIDERRCIPPHIVLEFGNHGLFGLQIAREYGGLGLSTCDALAVMRQLGAIDLTLATLVSTHANGLYAVQHHGCAALKKEFLPQFASGRQLCGFGLTEFGAGSNPWAIEMSAHALPNGGWRLHGRKIWVDSGAWASLVTMFAQTHDPRTGSNGISAFAVPLANPGVIIETEAPTMGLRGMVQNNIRLHYSVVQEQGLLGQIGQGMAIAQQALNIGRLMLAAKSLGATGRCLQLMMRYAKRRQVATGRLLDNPVILGWLGDLNARMLASQCLTWQLGQQIDQGVMPPQDVIFALKNAAVETLWESADLALQTLGGRGYMENNILPQILRDARTMRISEGPTETLNMALGASLVNAGAPVFEYMRQHLAAPLLAQQLQDAIPALVGRLSASDSGFSDQQVALQWAYSLLGQSATCALLLAALEYESRQTKPQRGDLQNAIRCLQAQFAASLVALAKAGPAELASIHAPDTDALLLQLEESLGQIEQTAAGVDYSLDPMLQPQTQVAPPCKYWQTPFQALHLSPDYARSNAAPDFSVLRLPWHTGQTDFHSVLRQAGLHPDTLWFTVWSMVLQNHTGQAQLSLAYAPASTNTEAQEILPISFSLAAKLADALQELDQQLAMARQMRHSPALPGHAFLDKLSLLLALGQVPPVNALPALEIMLCIEDQVCAWHFDQHLFAPASIERMHMQCQTVLQAMLELIASPTATQANLADLPMMSEAANLQLTQTFNQTSLQITGPQCVHEYFEQQAAQNGAAIAAICGAQQCSFAALNQQAQAVAEDLRQAGVTPGDFVGLCIYHSLEMLVGLLAILKTGAAYIPLDPDYPSQRIKFVLEDSELGYILTSADLQARLPEHHAKLVLFDMQTQAQDSASPTPLPRVKPDSTAYVLYTSGSTGQPKGVRVSHSAVVNFLHAMQQHLQLGPQDVVLAHTTLAFDIAGLEIFMPLAWGCRMLLTPPALRRDPAALLDYMQQHKLTLLQATPAFWHMLLLAGWPGNDNLVALCGGEALGLELARQLVSKCRKLWNMYGPTEATIWCAMQEVKASMLLDSQATIPLGKPVANTHFYVLDHQQRLLPLGVPGELCIAGANLAQGYWRREAIEEEKFFTWHNGQRLYRSGDLVRWRDDGVLLFMGRQDRQIKLRGYRIEPAEIESWLASHPAVEDAVVITVARASHDVLLVAYLQTHQPLEVQALRTLLASHIPPYMMPNHFVCLPALPLTANGKIDYLALPALLPTSVLEHADPAQVPLAAGSALQQTLRQMWAESLQMSASQITLDSHFFAIGGHSLLAAQIVSRLNQQFQINLSLADFFSHPSISSLSQCLEQEYFGHTAKPNQLPQAIAHSGALPIPLSNTQKSMMFKLQSVFPGYPSIYNTSMSWLIKGELEHSRLEQALHLLQARHPVLSTRIQLNDGKLANITQLCEPPIRMVLRKLDLRSQMRGTPDDMAIWQPLIIEYERQVFDMEHGPMVRVQLLQLAEESTILQIVIHHILIDGTSITILLAELAALYANPEVQLRPQPIQFADYLLWEAAHGSPSEVENYWLDYLTPLPPDLRIPQIPDAPGQECTTVVGSHAVMFDSAKLSSLQKIAQQENCTLFMLLMSAFALVLAKHSNEQEMLIGYPMANRPVPGTESMVASFAKTLPMRLRCSTSSRLSEVLPQVKESISASLQYSDMNFPALLERLGLSTRVNHHPLFQIIFLLEEMVKPEFEGLQLQALPGHPLQAKYDLLLYAQLADALPGSQQLRLFFQYDKAAFTRATIELLAQEMHHFLENLTSA